MPDFEVEIDITVSGRESFTQTVVQVVSAESCEDALVQARERAVALRVQSVRQVPYRDGARTPSAWDVQRAADLERRQQAEAV